MGQAAVRATLAQITQNSWGQQADWGGLLQQCM